AIDKDDAIENASNAILNILPFINSFRFRRARPAANHLVCCDRDAKNIPGVRISKAVMHKADEAILTRACMRSFLTRRLIRPDARSLIYFRAGIPEQELVCDVAGYSLAVNKQIDRF